MDKIIRLAMDIIRFAMELSYWLEARSARAKDRAKESRGMPTPPRGDGPGGGGEQMPQPDSS